MKNFDDIEKFVRCGKPIVKTNRQLDKQTLDDSYAAMEKTIESTSKDYNVGKLKFTVRNRVTKLLATAAAIIMAIGLFIILLGPNEKSENIDTTEVTKSATDMQSVMSLNIAFRHGGMEAVERQSEKAIKMLGPRPAEITVQQMLSEFNGT